ncbi:Cof-type HAD-IIB family hydrolase [Schleiferilactobacillus shenzhenensis]|uniref:YkrA n=1 Tax=Schleiferilactobacillus shenzhenensis LY-73 TaxID=1231336 RepID=U4TX36_9LACO|nr:Cof-type HAD-IIB family hydrolase [Schleiferilactobacillus shenzhenensis]ERL66373.1 hypothetical protein L248_0052 [Schleiferilactobacillus shenzhenensis LY-73]
MAQYKGIVFFDLDGTLLNAHSLVDKATGQAIHQLRANGYLPIIATGRHPTEIRDARQVTGIDTFISLNGAYIEHNGQAIYKGIIPTPTVGQLVRIGDALGEAISMYTHDTIRTTRDTADMRAAYNYIHTPIPAVDHDFYKTHEILMLLVLTDRNDGRYTFPLNGSLTFYRNGPDSIDTVKKNESKRRGVERLIKLLDLAGVPTWAFGDGPNDIPMLDYVDHPVVMANGITAAKDRAEFITAANTAGGIVTGLRHYQLID